MCAPSCTDRAREAKQARDLLRPAETTRGKRREADAAWSLSPERPYAGEQPVQRRRHQQLELAGV
jgi:hypothetical protein